MRAPNVTILITNRDGVKVGTASVGDPLAVRFLITDTFSPYEIFIHSLVAMDGLDRSEIILIDKDGCPTDTAILGPITKLKGQEKVLQATFEAFKFPASQVVLFKAVVTPCLAKCNPIHCYVNNFDGNKIEAFSYGRRRRRRRAAKNDMVLIESIMIKDVFDFDKISPSKKLYKNFRGKYYIMRHIYYQLLYCIVLQIQPMMSHWSSHVLILII